MKYELIIFGCSFGGFQAMQIILNGLGTDFVTPIVLVQHRDKSPGDLLSQILQRSTHMKVQDADDGMKIAAGNLYVAPASYHLLIDNKAISLSCELPVQHAQPSIDVAFDTASLCYGSNLIGVVLTSSSIDGVSGAKSIVNRDGALIVQDPATAESVTLPKAVIAAVENARVVPLENIAGVLREMCNIRGGKNAQRSSR
jgi:two-component system chemotaxis response regulator CheB